MADFIFIRIDGVDISHLLISAKYKRADVDSADAGRTQDATMHRGRVAIKDRIDCVARRLTQAESQMLFGLLQPEYVTVDFLSPRSGFVTETMYSNNIETSYARVDTDGTIWWDGFTFPLIQR